MLAREGKSRLCPLVGRRGLAAELMERGSPAENKGQTVGVRQARGQSEGSVAALQGLVRISKMPEDTSQKAETRHPGVLRIKKSKGAMLVRVVESDALLQMDSGKR
jgi:hypothetical protein